jgi:hypothetical protein
MIFMVVRLPCPAVLFLSTKKVFIFPIPPPLPTFRSGGMLVDVADRDALYQAMEGR